MRQQALRLYMACLVKQLHDHDGEKREHAARSLGTLGAAAACVVPALLEVLKDVVPRVRMAACYALQDIGPTHVATVPALATLLTDEVPHVRQIAAFVLGRMGRAEEAAAPLIAALEDVDLAVRVSACNSLAMIGPAAVAAVPALIALLRDREPEMRQEAAFALKQMGRAGEVVLALVVALDDTLPIIRKVICNALGGLGPAALDAVPALAVRSKLDVSPDVRNAAKDALRRIGPGAWAFRT